MKKRIVSFLAACLMVVCLLPVEASAADSQVVYYDDGSYEVITVENTGGARATTIN